MFRDKLVCFDIIIFVEIIVRYLVIIVILGVLCIVVNRVLGCFFFK